MGKSLIAAVLVACLVVSAAALTMKIDPKAEECFSEVLQVGDDVEVRWGVQDGGLLDIDVRVCIAMCRGLTYLIRNQPFLSIVVGV